MEFVKFYALFLSPLVIFFLLVLGIVFWSFRATVVLESEKKQYFSLFLVIIVAGITFTVLNVLLIKDKEDVFKLETIKLDADFGVIDSLETIIKQLTNENEKYRKQFEMSLGLLGQTENRKDDDLIKQAYRNNSLKLSGNNQNLNQVNEQTNFSYQEPPRNVQDTYNNTTLPNHYTPPKQDFSQGETFDTSGHGFQNQMEGNLPSNAQLPDVHIPPKQDSSQGETFDSSEFNPNNDMKSKLDSNIRSTENKDIKNILGDEPKNKNNENMTNALDHNKIIMQNELYKNKRFVALDIKKVDKNIVLIEVPEGLVLNKGGKFLLARPKGSEYVWIGESIHEARNSKIDRGILIQFQLYFSYEISYDDKVIYTHISKEHINEEIRLMKEQISSQFDW